MDRDYYIGRLLDNRYELLEVIGTGGMAIVYRARDHRLNRLVAVKILKDDYSQDEEFRRRFHAESQAVAMLGHPNIVAVYDVSTGNGADYIVMELIDGISLKQYMEKKGILNWKETLHFGIQIAKALEHAHSRGIVHRDIKPHNVMVLKNGSVKVTDFGIARIMSKTNTLTKEALGSVHYISPEQAKGGRVDNRSDLYSLGVVMYEMMTGRPPYDGESPVAVAIQHINGGAVMPTVLNPNIPGGLEQIIMKAMSVEPAQRYTTASTMLADMDEFRKNPALLFDYNMSAVSDATQVHAAALQREVKRQQTDAQRAEARRTQQPPRRQTERQQPVHRQRQEPVEREKERETDDSRSRVTTIAIVSCCAVAVLALIIFLVAVFNGSLFGKTQTLVEVPLLLGKDYDGLVVHEDVQVVLQDREYDSFYEKGQIMRQEPAAGSQVVPKTQVWVTVSLGEEPQIKTMENMVGLSEANAKGFLDGLGLELHILPREEFSEDMPVGNVIRTEPEVGAELTKGQTVTLWISKGPEEKTARMPNVVGQTVTTATSILNASGFHDVEFEPVESGEEKDTVVRQSVERNTVINVKTQIILYISKGAAPTTTPPTQPSTDPSTEPTKPSEPTSTKRVTLTLPSDRTEPYTLSLRMDGEKVIDDTQVDPSHTSSIDVSVEGSGVAYYDLYINDTYYDTIKVDFSDNG